MLGIIALLITTIGGSFGVTWLNNQKELKKLKLKMQSENEDKIEEKLKKYISYVEGKLDEANKRAETLYNQYIQLQNEAIHREAELQAEKQKSLTAIQELQIVKHEYQVLKSEFVSEKKRLEGENKDLRNSINHLTEQQEILLARIRALERGQITLSDEVHHQSIQK